MNPKLDVYFKNAKQWREEFEKLRTIVLGFPLEEELKWRWPCYSSQGSNIVLMHGFKGHCALLFFKGALLKDAKGILVKPGENTQASRQIRFTGMQQIAGMEGVLKTYIREAIEVEKAGLKVELKKTEEFAMPQEFRNRLDKMRSLKTAFAALTPGRQRAYILHFSAAKQSQTRESRVEQCVPKILDGKGLND